MLAGATGATFGAGPVASEGLTGWVSWVGFTPHGSKNFVTVSNEAVAEDESVGLRFRFYEVGSLNAEPWAAVDGRAGRGVVIF